MPAPGLTVAGKTYDGTTAVGPINTSLTGVLPGDSVNFMMWGAQFASANAGTWTVAPGTVSGSNLVSGEHEYILSGWDAQNYSLQSIASTTATITPANATITVMPYFVTYDDTFHYVTSAVTGVSVVSYPGNAVPPMPVWNVQQLPSSDLIIHSTPEISAGTYTDSWTFSDPSGNYYSASGTIVSTIAKAQAVVSVLSYNTFYNALPHTTVGAAVGVNGTVIAGLNLSGTTHSAVGNYADIWTFSNPNYNPLSGVVSDNITPSKSKMVKETVLVPKTTTIKATVLVPGIKNVKVVERVLVNGKWVKKTVLVPETVLVKKTVLVNKTKMTKKTEMVKVYYI